MLKLAPVLDSSLEDPAVFLIVWINKDKQSDRAHIIKAFEVDLAIFNLRTLQYGGEMVGEEVILLIFSLGLLSMHSHEHKEELPIDLDGEDSFLEEGEDDLFLLVRHLGQLEAKDLLENILRVRPADIGLRSSDLLVESYSSLLQILTLCSQIGFLLLQTLDSKVGNFFFKSSPPSSRLRERSDVGRRRESRGRRTGVGLIHPGLHLSVHGNDLVRREASS